MIELNSTVMSSENPKRAIYESFAVLGRALGNAHRLEILEHLGQGERAVEGIAARAGLSVANASQHLQALRRAGVVSARRAGKSVLYRLSDDAVIEAMSALRRIAERNIAEVQRTVDHYFGDRDSLEPIAREALLRGVKEGLMVVIDVRPADEFAQGHVPGAINIPLHALKRRLADLPKRKEIVAYCRGPYCVLSFDAVDALRKKGFRARRLEEGFPEWRAAGLPVEAEPAESSRG
jgi:rhodanese-related sulfurtransferase/DNA-binding transcriptional ArsR family regulator